MKSNQDTLLKLGSILWPQLIKSMIMEMPLRGCISIGECHADNKLAIGPAIDEASKYHAFPEWCGISASPSAHKIIERFFKNNPKAINRVFQKYDLPLKNLIEQNAWVIKWPDVADDFVPEYSNIVSKNYTNMLEVIEDNIEKTKEIEASLKWRNTLKFYEATTNQ